jgi:hypothetical protein
MVLTEDTVIGTVKSPGIDFEVNPLAYSREIEREILTADCKDNIDNSESLTL